MNANTTKIIAVTAVLMVIGAGAMMYFNGGGENGEDGEDDGYISFFLFDNYQYQTTTGLLQQNNHLADGFWVKGYGDTKIEQFEDACERAGIDVVVAGGGIASWNGINDENFCHMGWLGGKWTSEIWLGSTESYKVKYMALGHGRWSGGSGGDPPTPWQTPDDIKWYYGESAAPDAGIGARFYFYDNYENDPPADPDDPSKIARFVADGYWVTGYGNTAGEAFRNACAKAYGADAAVVYDEGSGHIARISNVGSNLHSMLWDGAAWTPVDLSVLTLADGMFIAVGHGAENIGTGALPTPWQTPADMNWSL